MAYQKVRGFLEDISEDLKKGFQEYSIVQVDYEDLRQDPLNAEIYDPIGDEHIRDLRDSILEIGLQQPLVVRKDDAHCYTILSGHNRYAAIGMIKEEDPARFLKVPCYVRYETISPAMEKIFIVTQNIQRVKTPADISREIKALQEAYDEMTAAGETPPASAQAYISSLMNMSYSSVARYNRIEDNLTEDLKDRFYAGEITVNTADKLAAMPEDEQQALARKFTGTEKITVPMIEKELRKKKERLPKISVSFTLEELAAIIGPEPITKTKLRGMIIKALGSWCRNDTDL